MRFTLIDWAVVGFAASALVAGAFAFLLGVVIILTLVLAP